MLAQSVERVALIKVWLLYQATSRLRVRPPCVRNPVLYLTRRWHKTDLVFKAAQFREDLFFFGSSWGLAGRQRSFGLWETFVQTFWPGPVRLEGSDSSLSFCPNRRAISSPGLRRVRDNREANPCCLWRLQVSESSLSGCSNRMAISSRGSRAVSPGYDGRFGHGVHLEGSDSSFSSCSNWLAISSQSSRHVRDNTQRTLAIFGARR